MNLQIAVPSHDRADRCNEATLRLLANRGIHRESVTVFVAPGEGKHYQDTLDKGLHSGAVIEGSLGLGPQRNFITGWFPRGTPVVHIDDDITDVRRKVNDKTTAPVEDLAAFFEWAFRVASTQQSKLWGVYPVLNAMFMGEHVRVGLNFCIGQLWGVFNEPRVLNRLSQKEDYERTLRFYDLCGKVVRMDMVACKTKMYAPGGMQADDQPNRRRINMEAVTYLMKQWPNNVALKAKENPKVGPEIRLVERSKTPAT